MPFANTYLDMNCKKAVIDGHRNERAVFTHQIHFIGVKTASPIFLFRPVISNHFPLQSTNSCLLTYSINDAGTIVSLIHVFSVNPRLILISNSWNSITIQ